MDVLYGNNFQQSHPGPATILVSSCDIIINSVRKYSSIGSLIIIVFVIISITLGLLWSSTKKPSQPETKMQPKHSKQSEVKNEISYILLEGWQEAPQESEKINTILSPDYEHNGGFGREKGVRATISKFETLNPAEILDETINPSSGAFGAIDPTSIEELKIDGKRAIKAESNNEGLTLIYRIEGNNSVWQVNFHYINRHRDSYPNIQGINKLISSLKFKEK